MSKQPNKPMAQPAPKKRSWLFSRWGIGLGVLLLGVCCVATVALPRPAATPTPAPQATAQERTAVPTWTLPAAVGVTEEVVTLTPKPQASPTVKIVATASPTLAIPTVTVASQPTATAPSVQATATVPTLPTDTQVPQPTQPPAITLVSLTSPISAGSDARLVIQTAPGAACFLSYVTPSGTDSTADGLGAMTADGSGICTWVWRISGSTNPGTGRLTVTTNGATQFFEIVIQ